MSTTTSDPSAGRALVPVAVPVSPDSARNPAVAVAAPDSDTQLVALWLHGRPQTTASAYALEIRRFRTAVGVGVPLAQLTLADLHRFADALAAPEAGLAPASRARALAAVKSLLSFGHRLGLLPVDVGRAVRLPRLRDQLAERILSEADTHRLIAAERDARNRALLRLLYAGGVRVSEACGLRWRDLSERLDGHERAGQVTVWGKGGKTRAVRLPAAVWQDLQALRHAGDGEAGAEPDAPVFRSAKGGPLSRRQVLRIVRAAAERAGITGNVSPHWLRHAHASHALDRGAPISLVQQTLGHTSVATTGRYTHARPSDSSSRYLAI